MITVREHLPLNVQRDYGRWYDLKEHPVQRALIDDQVRFKVVPAGRRSGKTERAKRFIVKEAFREVGPYFVAAPTRGQVKKIYWNDLKQLALTSLYGPRSVSESELEIRLPNGSTITLIGLDTPQRIEGSFWKGGVIDEIADIKEDAWELNISPALDTYNPQDPDYRAWCWLIGVPEGLNHYYDIAEYARTSGDPDWKLYTWHSADILPEDTIIAAKRRMSAKQYKQEYEASFETAGGKIYEDYGKENLTQEVISPHEQLHWFHDFNYTPMSSGIGVRRGHTKQDFYCLDEIILESAISLQSAQEFVERYKNHQNRNLLLYGDPAGRAGEKHGHASDYTAMEDYLRGNGWKVTRQVKAAAPAIKDRQNAVRAKIKNALDHSSLFVNPAKCAYTHKGLSTVQAKEGSTFLEEETKYQHITTAVGYCVDYIWPIKLNKPDRDSTPIPSKNYFNRSSR